MLVNNYSNIDVINPYLKKKSFPHLGKDIRLDLKTYLTKILFLDLSDLFQNGNGH